MKSAIVVLALVLLMPILITIGISVAEYYLPGIMPLEQGW